MGLDLRCRDDISYEHNILSRELEHRTIKLVVYEGAELGASQERTGFWRGCATANAALYRTVAAALHTVRSQHLVIEKEAVRGADAPYNRAARDRVEKRREGDETNTSYNKVVK